jgi:hypothetical protein
VHYVQGLQEGPGRHGASRNRGSPGASDRGITGGQRKQDGEVVRAGQGVIVVEFDAAGKMVRKQFNEFSSGPGRSSFPRVRDG